MSIQIVAERETTHGPFRATARYSQDLKSYIRGVSEWDKLPKAQKEALENIMQKVARILSGNHFTGDHWDDIAGYAELGAKHCRYED